MELLRMLALVFLAASLFCLGLYWLWGKSS